MKRIFLFIGIMFCTLVAQSQELTLDFSDAAGNGWAVMSGTPHTVTITKPTGVYPLIPSGIKTSDYQGFKITFKSVPAEIKMYVRETNAAGEDKMLFESLKLNGLTMNYTFGSGSLETIEKLGVRLNGDTKQSSVDVEIESFYLIDKNGNEVETALPSVADARKPEGWSRAYGASAVVVFTGNYNRDVEWAPAKLNDYNNIVIEFGEPLKADLSIRLKMKAGKKEEMGYKTAKAGSTSFNLNLGKEYKERGYSILAILFTGATKGDMVNFKSVKLTK